MLKTGEAFEQQLKSIQMLSLNLEQPNLHKYIKLLQKITWTDFKDARDIFQNVFISLIAINFNTF